MRDLKKHIKDLNGTEKESNEGITINLDPKPDLENRRGYKGLEYYKMKDHLKEPFDFEKALKPKRISGIEWKEMKDNRYKMQQKLDMWIKERQKERDRIQKYRMERQQLMLSGKYEKCPRFGYSGRKRKERNKDKQKVRHCRMEYNATLGREYEKCIEFTPELVTTANDGRRRRKRRYEQNKYPCCRKCCKQSYMGCL
ncbi:uncharacterized protein LOC120634937 [Pararge aegeria]|nr:uncharacterized protein LOC120634937 [Pararge aegeria]